MEVINLNFIPSGANPVAHASQFDEGRTTRFNLFDGSAVYTLDGTEIITVSVRKPDGHIVTESVTNTSSNYVEVVTTEQMTACAGDNLAQIKVEKGGDTIGFLNYILSVQKDPEDGGDPSASFIHDLEQQIADAVADQYDAADVIFDAAPTAGHGVGFAVTSEGVKDAIDTAIGGLTIPEELDDLSDVTITSPSNGEILVFDGAEWVNQANPASTANFAADYDDTATYNTNDKVIYQGLYYIALEDSITGAWDSTKWALTTVSALTAEELPLSGNDSTPTATAIGSLSDLTTTNQDSLVDAVNEVVSTKANASDFLGCKLRTFVIAGGATVTVTGTTGIIVASANNNDTTAGAYAFSNMGGTFRLKTLASGSGVTITATRTDGVITFTNGGASYIQGVIVYA